MSHGMKKALFVAALAFTTCALAEQQVPMYQAGGTQPVVQGSQAAVSPQWIAAATQQMTMLVRNSAPNIAMSIQGTTHPSGNSAYLMNFNVLNLSNRIMVQLNVGWKGGFLGNVYQTSVNWEVSPEGHLGAKVVGDTAMVGIEPANLRALDDYFKQSVYPVFYSNMEGVGYTWKN